MLLRLLVGIQTILSLLDGRATLGITAAATTPSEDLSTLFNENETLYCDFEMDFCLFTQANDDDMKWKRNSGSTASSGTGPSVDHTFGTSVGCYVYMEVSGGIPGYHARLHSPSLVTHGTYCVKFYYHMHGATVGSLHVYFETSSLGSASWSAYGSQGDRWHLAQLEFDVSSTTQVVFEGVRGSSDTGDIALDDVWITSGSCTFVPPPSYYRTTTALSTTLFTVEETFYCDFEADFCHFTQANDDDINWKRNSGSTTSSGTGPSVDHTFGTSVGCYVYMEVSGGIPGNHARLQSPSLVTQGTYCVKFYYHMYGATVGSLHVYFETSSLGSASWSAYGSQGDRWHSGQIEFDVSSTTQVVFEGVRGSSDTGDIALDDVWITSGSCTFVPPPYYYRTTTALSTTLFTVEETFYCDFETDFCHFTQATDDDINWTRNSGSTTSSGTGPSVDHTFGTSVGCYVYMEVSGGIPGYHARLHSPSLVTQGTYCVQFYYHMHGATVGSLHVYFETSSLGSASWSAYGSQGDRWHLGQLEFDVSSTTQVVFEGVRGSSDTGDIALDDVWITSGSCTFVPPPSYYRTTTALSTTLFTVEETFYCDFEADFCHFTQANDDDINWKRNSGSTTSSGTGPSVDHTFGTSVGCYVYMEVSGGIPGNHARLQSPSLVTQGTYCVKFYYHMHGATVGSLHVFFETSSLGSASWSAYGSQGDRWHLGQIEFDVSSTTQVVFEGVRGSSYTGNIALDDVWITSGSCTFVPPPSYYRTTTALSTTLFTVEETFFCDFETDFCHFTQANDDDINWTRNSGSTTSSGTGPSVDHTFGTSVGCYVYMEVSGGIPGYHARLHSPSLVTHGTYCVKFYYHMYGATVGSLHVYFETSSLGSASWSAYGSQGDRWHSGQIEFDVSSTTHVVFEGVRGSSDTGDIALDDVWITSGSCFAFVTAPPEVNCTLDCDFEIDFCGYTQESRTDNFDWNRHNGVTHSHYTGPSYDHTFGNYLGHYVYIEASSPVLQGQQARLHSPSLGAYGYVCIEFYYHMYGDSIGSLHVYASTSSLGSPIWSMYGQQGEEWKRAQVEEFGHPTTKVVFEGVRGTNYDGDIAIDDIRVTSGNCLNGGFFDDTTEDVDLKFDEESSSSNLLNTLFAVSLVILITLVIVELLVCQLFRRPRFIFKEKPYELSSV
ncbi:MAM and LDL-receptor class A domain-containing protein 2-like isoform X3 [Apostichopus japonicus]|uniref:MAM and LDL-receptor class A domain-containing protein 2-like isoform X3 n=1 Tax=Stichopus japonicus TaxID=307972 RepID=UPI003AB20765